MFFLEHLCYYELLLSTVAYHLQNKKKKKAQVSFWTHVHSCQVIVGYGVVQHHAQWNWEGFYLCSTPGCGVTTHPECHVPFLYGDAENSNLGGGKRFSARYQKYTSVTSKKKIADYKVYNKLR